MRAVLSTDCVLLVEAHTANEVLSSPDDQSIDSSGTDSGASQPAVGKREKIGKPVRLRSHLLRFVVDFSYNRLYNKLCDKSRTNRAGAVWTLVVVTEKIGKPMFRCTTCCPTHP